MSFESSMMLLVGMIVLFPILFGIPRLVNWIAGRKMIPYWPSILLLVGGVVGTSFYLDAAGELASVPLLEKKEQIRLRRNGGWDRHFNLALKFERPGEISTSSIQLTCDAKTYDSLKVGQPVEARVLNWGPWFRFARLKDQSTFSFLSNLVPPAPAGPWRQATAIVSEVSHVTEYRIRTRRRGRVDIQWPFDVVQLTFTPPGRLEPVTAVDVVDAGSVPGHPTVAKGASIQITWPEDDPRSAKIVGAQPGRVWANWFYSMTGVFLVLGGIIAFLLIFAVFRRRSRKI